MSAEALNYIISIQENFDKVNTKFDSFQNKFTSGIDTINRSFSAIRLNALIQNIDSAASGLESLNAPGMALNSNMYELSAITGVTGNKLKEIEGYARENAKTFGGSASQSVESYKLVLSQLTPEIAKVPSALKGMGETITITSKLMGGDATAATEVLTTAMNQYQVSLKDPIKAQAEMAKMTNVMAAAANEGSAELPQIKAALEQSGLAAKTANIAFEETNAAIQVLDKAGKKGSEGGVALRNTLSSLAQGRFLPKDVKQELQAAGVDINILSDNSLTLAERLTPLKKIMNDQALVSKFFGKENAAAGIALISNISEIESLTTKVSGTNSAWEQAGTIMESQAEKNARLKAQIDDFKISIFNSTNGLMGYASEIANVTRDVSQLMPILSGFGTVISTVTSVQKMQALWTSIVSGATAGWTVVQGAFNAVMAMNPVILITMAVIALIGAIVWVVSATEGWGAAWQHTVNGAKLLFKAYVESVKANFNLMINGIMIGINKIQIGWYKFKNAVGMGDSSQNTQMINQLNQDVEQRKESIKEGYKKAVEYGTKAGEEFGAAFNSVKWKEKGTSEAETESGIEDPTTPGTIPGTNKNGTGAAAGSGKDKSKRNEAVATGGTKHNYITISIAELIGLKTNSVTGGKDAANKAGNEVADELLRVIAMASTSTG